MRKIVQSWGLRGQRRCHVIRDDRGYLSERYLDGKPKRLRHPDRATALVWAEQWYQSGQAVSSDLTIRQLFDRFFAVVPDQREWRGATRLNARWHRHRIEEALGPDFPANRVNLLTMDEVWQKLIASGMAPNQVRNKIKLLQRIFTWGHSRELVNHGKPGLWDVPEVRPAKPGEFTEEEATKLHGAFDYQRTVW